MGPIGTVNQLAPQYTQIMITHVLRLQMNQVL